jgi:hypothetical protein
VANFNYELGNSGKNSKVATWVGGIVAFLFATPFTAFGIFAFFDAWKNFHSATPNLKHNPIITFVFGLIFSAIGFGIMYAALTAGRRQRQAEEKWNTKTDGGKKIWLARDDWATGKIKSSATAQSRIIFIFALAFGCFGAAMSFFVLPRELHGGNSKALAILLFPAIGIGCGIAAIRGILARRRFGDCWFELAQVPAPLGGSLDGLIQTERTLHLEQELHLKLSCISRTVTSSGDRQHVSENFLWQSEKIFRPDAALPMTGAGGSGIPIHFDLPADKPESSLRDSSTIIWRLEARAKMAGPDFAATFEVPVFRVAGFVPPPKPEEVDPTTAMQMSAEEIRRDENSKIQITDGPIGREFYFPPARNLGTTCFTTLFMLVFNGAAVFMYRAHAPILFPIVFGLVGVLLILGTFNLWFQSSRITIDSTNVQLTKHWLILSRTRQFLADDIARFATKAGIQSGSQVFTDIKLIPRGSDEKFAASTKFFHQTFQDTFQEASLPEAEKVASRFRQAAGPSGVTVVGSIANLAEANWLVAEMNKALGRQ